VPQLGYNFAHYVNEELDQLLIKARTTIDPDQRVALYKEAQQILMTEVPHLVVDHEIQVVAMKNNVSGFVLHPRALFRFFNVDIVN
jgi:peptide/nickel transport system substrate-binding protein